MKIEKQTLKLVKFIKFITAIGITISALLILGCVGGYETDRMTTEQFFTYTFRAISATLISSAIYAMLDKFQRYTENIIRKRKRV